MRRITNLSQRGNSTGRSPDHRAWARPRDSACQVRHVGMFHLGRMHVAHDDGTDGEIGPAEANVIKPGHDAWVVGNDPVIAFEFESQSEDYAVLNPPTLSEHLGELASGQVPVAHATSSSWRARLPTARGGIGTTHTRICDASPSQRAPASYTHHPFLGSRQAEEHRTSRRAPKAPHLTRPPCFSEVHRG